MLNEKQHTLWQQLQSTLSHEQRIWFAGYVQGLVQGGATTGVTAGAGATAAAAPQKLHIYFATETGNAKMVAQQLAKDAKTHGWNAQTAPVKKVKFTELAKTEDPVIFISSTHGEGDPPETAVSFFEDMKKSTVSLKGVKYAVLGLGDTSYKEFCKAARDIDEHLTRMGAEAFHPRKELDVDYASHVPGWVQAVVAALPSHAPAASTTPVAVVAEPVLPSEGYSRLKPITGRVAEIINLNDRGSKKETYHIEIEYDAPLVYEAGDAAGIILPHYQDGIDHLTPRLYSIASAPSAHGNSIHLTVALAWHLAPAGEKEFGVSSGYLSKLKEGDEIQFYIHRNHMFRLPEDDRDMIMVGPGTGIAPFRSFVWERVERGASGRNWLFFGEQHAHCDFLYQSEWIDHVETGVIQNIDLAFSRDQEHKVYVQHRMKEKADELYEWLEGGAHVYICGNKDPMSYDVENTLKEIIAAKRGDMDAAEQYLEQLQDENRYVKDVY